MLRKSAFASVSGTSTELRALVVQHWGRPIDPSLLFVCHGGNQLEKAFCKDTTVESPGVCVQPLRIPVDLFDFQQSLSERFCCRLREKDSRLTVDYRVEGPAGAVGHAGFSRSIRFQWCHPEIFFARKQKRTTILKCRRHLRVGQTPEECCIRPCDGFEALAICAVSDDNEPSLRLLAGSDCQINPLVRYQT